MESNPGLSSNSPTPYRLTCFRFVPLGCYEVADELASELSVRLCQRVDPLLSVQLGGVQLFQHLGKEGVTRVVVVGGESGVSTPRQQQQGEQGEQGSREAGQEAKSEHGRWWIKSNAIALHSEIKPSERV